MRTIATLNQRLRRNLSGLTLLLMLSLLVTASPSLAQSEEAAPPSAPTAPPPEAEPSKSPPTDTPAAPSTEGAAPTDSPAAEPGASPSPSIEDLYAPDLPQKTPDKSAPKAEEKPVNKEPILYISDTDNGRIVVMQGIKGEGFTSLGLPGYGLGRFLRPAQIWVDYAGRLYIADSGNNRIVRIDRASDAGWSEVGSLSDPHGVAVDGSGVYVSDTRANRVVMYKEIVNGAKVEQVLTHPQLKRPGELWIDNEGALYICCGEDPPGGKVLKTWIEKGLAEKGVQKETRRWAVFEGEGLSGSRFLPASIVTEKGSLRMLDVSGQRLLSMQDIAGKRLKEERFRLDPRFRLSRPNGMGVDATGRLFIADSGNDRILELAKDGSVVGEYIILEDDPATMLANPTSIFIFSPAPPPPPPSEDDEEGGKKGKGKGKAKPKKGTDSLEFDSGF